MTKKNSINWELKHQWQALDVELKQVRCKRCGIFQNYDNNLEDCPNVDRKIHKGKTKKCKRCVIGTLGRCIICGKK